MLSTISGKFFAGHQVQRVILPPSTMYYNMALGSYSGSGGTITNLVGSTLNLTAQNVTTFNYTSTTPTNIQFTPFGGTAATSGEVQGENNLSTTDYITASFWYKQTNTVTNSELMFSLAAPDSPSSTYDGAYMTAWPNGVLQIVTNGAVLDTNRFSANNTIDTNTWQMVTFKFILSPTLPCVLYVNGTSVLSYIHGNDSISGGPYISRLTLGMTSTNGAWNDFLIANEEYTDAMVAERYASTRSYYGV